MKFQMVNPEKISMGSINPRTDLGDLDELTASMRERQERGQRAVVLPLLVRKLGDNEIHDFELIDGKRRLQSALQLRLPEVPIVEETDTDNAKELIVMSYLANESRKDFHWTERAQTFKKLNEEFEMTHEEIGQKVGLSRNRVTEYINVLNKLSSANVGAPTLDMETTREIVNKCPDPDIPELIAYSIEHNVPRDDMRKILFALRNYYASQEVVKDFHSELYNILQEKYHPWRFNPKFMALYQKEKTLRTGELNPVDYYLDIGDYPTRESAEEFAAKRHGEVVREVHRDGWHLRVYPYIGEDIDNKFSELKEKSP